MSANTNPVQPSDDDFQLRYAQIVAETWDAGAYEQSRTREELDTLLHHGHVIPVSRGFTAKYVAENYPGWTWNRLIDVLQAAGVLVLNPGGTPRCRNDALRVDFDSLSGWRVVWTDGTETRGAVPPGFSSRPESRGREIGAYNPGTARVYEVDADGRPIIE